MIPDIAEAQSHPHQTSPPIAYNSWAGIRIEDPRTAKLVKRLGYYVLPCMIASSFLWCTLEALRWQAEIYLKVLRGLTYLVVGLAIAFCGFQGVKRQSRRCNRCFCCCSATAAIYLLAVGFVACLLHLFFLEMYESCEVYHPGPFATPCEDCCTCCHSGSNCDHLTGGLLAETGCDRSLALFIVGFMILLCWATALLCGRACCTVG